MKRILWTHAGIALIILGGALACGSGHDTQPAKDSLPPLDVKVHRVRTLPVTGGFETSGVIEAREASDLSTKIAGRILKINVKEGQAVRHGQILAEVDAGDIKARKTRAEADLLEREAQYRRLEKLLPDGAATQRELDMARAAYESARAMKDEAENLLNYKNIRAPYDGILTRRYVDTGATVGPGQRVLRIETRDSVVIRVPVSEQKISFLEAGQTVEIYVTALDMSYPAVVGDVIPSSVLNGSFDVKIELENAGGDLLPGMSVRAAFSLNARTRDILLIPVSALRIYEALDGVLLAEEGVARFQLVKVRPGGEGWLEVLSGLEAGDEIILEAPPELRDGRRIRVLRDLP